MAKKKRPDPLVEALKQQIPYTIKMSDGGDLASMRKALKHGQTLTFSPVRQQTTVQTGDIVSVKWHGGMIIHLVGEVRNDEFLIINSMGGINGWVKRDALLGYVTEVIDPPPSLPVEQMLLQLEEAYQSMAEQTKLLPEHAARLFAVVADMRWYATLIGPVQWNQQPRLNLWSFEQHLWHLLKVAREGLDALTADAAMRLLEDAKEHVGQVAKITRLLNVANQAFVTTDGKQKVNVLVRNFDLHRDLVPLVNLRNEIAGPNWEPITVEQQTSELTVPHQHSVLDRWIAEEMDAQWWTILGHAFGVQADSKRYSVHIEVAHNWRKRGIGTALLGQAQQRAKSLNAEYLIAETPSGVHQPAAQAFLGHHGFALEQGTDTYILTLQ